MMRASAVACWHKFGTLGLGLLFLAGCSTSADDHDWAEIKRKGGALAQIANHSKAYPKCLHASEIEERLWRFCLDPEQKLACSIYIELLPNGDDAEAASRRAAAIEAAETEAFRARQEKQEQAKQAELDDLYKEYGISRPRPGATAKESEMERAIRQLKTLNEGTKAFQRQWDSTVKKYNDEIQPHTSTSSPTLATHEDI